MLAIHHLAVRVADLDRAEDFYRNLIGLPLIRRWTDDTGKPRSFWLALGGEAFLAVEKAPQGSPLRGDDCPGWHCISLGISVAGREEWKNKMAAAGFSVVRETDYTFYVRDPDGNLIGFSHYPDPKPSLSSAPASSS